MKVYKIFLVSFTVLFLLMGVVGASEFEDVAGDQGVYLNQGSNHLIGASEFEDVDGDAILNNSLNTDDDILRSDDNSRILKANNEFTGNTFSQLHDEIDNSVDNDVILIQNNIFQDGNDSILIRKSLTIDGNGYTLDAQKKSGIFKIESSNVVLKNIFFKNAKDETFGAICTNLSECYIDNCTFEDNRGQFNGAAIFSLSGDLKIYNSSFRNNWANGKNGGAIYSTSNTYIDKCIFFNNVAVYGGAIYSDNATISINLTDFSNNGANCGGALYCINSNSTMNNSFFTNNTAVNGGAINYLNSTTSTENCAFKNNLVESKGGAILLNDSDTNIINSYFEFNVAGEKGAAIYLAVSNRTVKSAISRSEFQNNKAKTYSLTVNETYATLLIKLIGWNNYINAIYSEVQISFSDVTYWNGDMTNTDDEINITAASGQNITLEIYDSQNALLVNTTLITNSFGEQYYNLFNLEDGRYTYNVYHLDDSYYFPANCNGAFTLNRNSSSINLSISNYDEFYYGNCNIPFDVINRTLVRFVITDENESVVYLEDVVDQYSRHVTVDLLARDEYYKITVYNDPSGDYRGSQDFKFFKILKANSNISINPINDTIFGQKAYVVCDVENKSQIILTVYDESKNIVFELITDDNEIELPSLPAGQYNVTAKIIDNESIIESVDSAIMNVLKANNTVNVSANDVVYGNFARIVISAEVDGNYTLDLDGDLIDIEILNGEGLWDIKLPVGTYYLNVSFDNPNYDSIITNATLNVLKANNNVYVLANNVEYGAETSIRIYADLDGTYLLDVNGSLVNVTVFKGETEVRMQLPVGNYYANVSFNNPYYDSNIRNATFNVLKARNNVSVFVDDVVEGNKVIVRINAQLDGVYLLDVNGTLINVSVVDGLGEAELDLSHGSYYANVTFDDSTYSYNYNSFITNATFRVLKIDNLVNVSVVDVVYGNDVVVRLSAQVDGVYLLDVNGTLLDVSVVGGVGEAVLDSGLSCGSYYANVTFVDSNYDTYVSNATFNVLRASNNVSVLVDDVVGENTVVVRLSAQVDGVYILDVNGILFNVSVVDGLGEVELDLSYGSYYANATFDDSNYDSYITNATFNVFKLSNYVNVSVDDIVDENKLIVRVSAQVDGIYILDVNGTLIYFAVVDGEGIVELDYLPRGSYYANVTFTNLNYGSYVTNASFDVLDSSNLQVDYYEDLDTGDVIFNMSVLDDVTGNITVNFDGVDYSGLISNGSALVRVAHPGFGDYDVLVSYDGDRNYLSKSVDLDVHVKKAAINIGDAVYGWAKNITYSAKLIYEDGNPCSNREVSFYINGKSIKSTTDRDGVASVVLSLGIGSYDVVVSCEYGNVTGTIKVVSRFSGNKNINMYYFDGTVYSFKVYGDDGNLVGANENVVISLNKKTYNLKTDKNGLVKFTIPNTVKIGTYTIKATYKGQTISNTVKVKQILSSKATVNVKKTAKTFSLIATLKKKLKNKKITFKFNGKTYTAKTNSNGVATIKISKAVIDKLKKGKVYAVKISYYSAVLNTKVKVI